MYGWDFFGYRWISGFRFPTGSSKNGVYVQFDCDFAPFRSQTLTQSHPQSCNFTPKSDGNTNKPNYFVPVFRNQKMAMSRDPVWGSEARESYGPHRKLWPNNALHLHIWRIQKLSLVPWRPCVWHGWKQMDTGQGRSYRPSRDRHSNKISRWSMSRSFLWFHDIHVYDLGKTNGLWPW